MGTQQQFPTLVKAIQIMVFSFEDKPLHLRLVKSCGFSSQVSLAFTV